MPHNICENYEKDFISAPLTQWGWNQPQRARISNVVHSRGQCSIISSISSKVYKQLCTCSLSYGIYNIEYIIILRLEYRSFLL